MDAFRDIYRKLRGFFVKPKRKVYQAAYPQDEDLGAPKWRSTNKGRKYPKGRRYTTRIKGVGLKTMGHC